MKTVLHIRSSGGVLGAENVIMELCKRSIENGYNVIVGAINNAADPYPEFLKVLEEEKIQTVLFTCANQFDLRCGWKIKDYVQRNKVDIVHTHGYKEDYFSILAGLKIPKIATNHLWKKFSWKNTFYNFLDSKFLRFFDHVVGVSDEIVAEMKQKKINKVSTIANGIDLSVFTCRSKSQKYCTEFDIDESTIVVGMISSINREKGHGFALQAFQQVIKEHKKIKLLIVGDGKIVDEVKCLAKSLLLDKHVIFAGKRTEIPEILSMIDIFLLPSLTEGMPMALLEAMAAKKAVIATDVGGIPNLIETEKNGLLIKPQDVTGIVNALCSLCVDKDKRNRFGENAYISVRDRYSSEYMAKSYCKLYDELTKR